jgi:hypothetical protein
MEKEIIIERGKEKKERTLTPEELEDRKAVKAEIDAFDEKVAAADTLINQYVAQGWKSPFDVIDDILEKGVSVVKIMRNKIKSGDASDDDMDVILERNKMRGTAEEQLEFIAENGIDAWKAREYDIRLAHPKRGQTKPNMAKPNGTSQPKLTEKIANLVKSPQSEIE